ncbi:MAG: hypothetical protein QJR14_00585 [Bacillota bacterium]|nr:hypothetical protein [Bacillota bacterium]
MRMDDAVIRCPHCGSSNVGKVDHRHYFCWECYVEFVQRGGRWLLYRIDTEGALEPLETAELVEERR